MEQPQDNLGWHFTFGDKLRDGRPVPPIGETLIHEGKIQIYQSGLHCSKRLIDALRYAPGATLHQVRFGGEVQHQEDKLVSRERTILRTLPQDLMLPVLIEFSASCAGRAAEGAAERAAWWAARAAAAAGEAVGAAARAAGWAARAAEWAAEVRVEREAQNQELTRLVEEAFAKMEAKNGRASNQGDS